MIKITHELLARFAPFNTLNFDYLSQVIDKASIKEFSKGTLIFKRGRELNEVFYLVSGTIDLIDAQFSISTLNADEELHRSALNTESPTPVSAVAKSAVVMLSVESDFLDLVMAWSESGGTEISTDSDQDIEFEEADESDWMSSLLQSPLFNKIPPSNIRQLFIKFKSHKVSADEVIIKEGERGEYFYVLESGSATVINGQGDILAALRPGDYFGEEALVGDTTRNATVKMLTAGKLMRLGKEDFVTLLQEPVKRFIQYDDLQSTAKENQPYQLLDVRLAVERRFQSVPNSRNIPLSQLRKALAGLDRQTLFAVTDDAGRRADVAVQLLNQAGFDAVLLQNAHLHHG